MKKLIKRTLIYLSPLIIVFCMIELFYRIVPNDYSVKYKTLPEKYNDTEVLIFGNSHTFYGLNPKYFERPTYNLAHISQPLYFDKILFDTYIDNFKNVKCLILHIEYTSLSEVVNTDENSWRKYYYQSYMNLNVPSINKYDGTKYFLSSTRTFNTNLMIISRYFNEGTIVDCDENGFGINYTKAKSNPILISETLIRIKAIEDGLFDFKDNINRVQVIIDKCKSKKIKVVLLNMPVTKYFADGVNQIKLKKIKETCQAFALKNSNVNYINLFKDKRFNNDDFFDSDHLNTDGAEKCSKIINDSINKLIFVK